MKRFSKWLLLFSILMFVFVALVACGETQKTTKPTKTNSYKDSEIYQVYLAYAENGGTLSYDEWYASIKGEKGDKGDKGDDGLTPYIGDNGNWWIGEEDTGTKAGSGSGKDVFFTGKCGEKTTWTMYVDGSLSISGTGRVTSTPWDRFSDLIYKTTIKKGIENIPNNAFSQCVNIIEIIISDSVTSIGNSAFSGCSKLTSITIPDSVTSIGEGAFSGWNSLTSVYYTGDIASWCGITFGNYSSNPLYYAHNLYIDNELIKDIVIPETVTKIKDYAFRGWNGTSITILDSVTSIGEYAFCDCSSLASVYYTGDIASWCGITFGWSSNPLVYAHNLYINNELIKEIVIPDTVTEIKARAFSGWNGTSITIPDSVTSIGDGAFSGCSSLQSITIPFVGNRAGATSSDTYQYPFGYIFGTSSYTGGTATTQYYYGPSTSSRTNTTYYIPSTLKSVTVTGGYIPYGAFSSCSSLTSITIPDSVTSIGEYAFDYCRSLTSVYYKGDIASWCGITFGNEYSNPLRQAHNLYIDNELIKDIVIPDTVTEIKAFAFHGWNGTSITIPDSVTSIGWSAFYNCYHLVEVYNKSSLNIEKGSSNYGCVGYYAKAIYTEEYTSKLSTDSNGYVIYTDGEEKSLIMYTGEEKELTLPEGITEINQHAFYENNKITSITTPASVTSIGSNAFYNCDSLTSVYYTGNIASWCGITFSGNPLYYAHNLYINNELIKDIIIPDTVTEIKGYAFQGWTGTSITIPASVTSIGSSAFSGCYHLVEVYNKSSLNIEKGSKENGYVGYYAKAIYTEEYTSKLSTDSNGYVIYTDGEDKILIGYMGEETELTLPDGITEINQLAFYNNKITSITIPDNVTSIGSYALYECSSLTSITFQGTKAQWNAISKGIYWNSYTGIYTVHCTDGDIEK